MPFFHQLLTSRSHRDAHSRIFDFLFFWPKNGHFWPKTQKAKNPRICIPAYSGGELLVKNGIKIRIFRKVIQKNVFQKRGILPDFRAI